MPGQKLNAGKAFSILRRDQQIGGGWRTITFVTVTEVE